ncbi:MAG: hypothetical protein ACLUSP_03170 [Christensenellales bacterium]
MKYIVTDVYFDENIASLGALTWVTHGSLGLSGKQYTGSIKLGATTEMYLYENGARVKGNVEANKWYKLVMPLIIPRNSSGLSLRSKSRQKTRPSRLTLTSIT